MSEFDLILFNGRIHTLEAVNRTVSGLAVRGGMIASAGDGATLLAQKGSATRLIDLAGRTDLPLFTAVCSNQTNLSKGEQQ